MSPVIPEYKSLNEKESKFFSSKKNRFYVINTKEEFEERYDQLTDPELHPPGKNFYRGTTEARYKLFNSFQRFCMKNALLSWSNKSISYIDLVEKIVSKARKKKLFNRVFEQYGNIRGIQRDFPILSILQHYKAPTPLMDWTLNIDIALFFATDQIKPNNENNKIDDYFSIYHILPKEQNKDTKAPGNQLQNILEWNKGRYPKITSFKKYENSTNFLLYISDFEQEDPILSYYNLNIVPQEGIFIFSPLPDKPIEDCFSNQQDKNRDWHLIPFRCYNIKKTLAEYIRRKLKKNGITKDYLFPNLETEATNVKESFLDELI